MCRRSESDLVHSQRRVQASSREICSGMAVTLAKRSGQPGDAADGPIRVTRNKPGRTSTGTLKNPPAVRPPSGGAPPIPMEKFVIEGGVPLSGTIVPAGNKNGALPILAACLLTEDEVILRNVPRIRDVEAMTLLLEQLGARVQWLGPGEISIDCSSVDNCEVDQELAERIRASFLLAGPLLARFGQAQMPPPGGDVIGRRRLYPHLDALRALGASIE